MFLRFGANSLVVCTTYNKRGTKTVSSKMFEEQRALTADTIADVLRVRRNGGFCMLYVHYAHSAVNWSCVLATKAVGKFIKTTTMTEIAGEFGGSGGGRYPHNKPRGPIIIVFSAPQLFCTLLLTHTNSRPQWLKVS